MIKSLPTLIKLQKAKVDTQRLALAAKQDILTSLENQMTSLTLRVTHERALAEQHPEHANDFGTFFVVAHHQLQQLEIARQVAASAVQAERDLLADLFAEQKRYETLHAEQQAAATAAANQREQQMLDEVALQPFTRREG